MSRLCPHLMALVMITAAVPGCSLNDGGVGGGGHSCAGADHRFEDAERWAGIFEKPERDEWQRPAYVLQVMALSPDARVADIGSATGYFPVRFAEALPRGRVYGIDIEPNLVRYLNRRAVKDGLSNLTSTLGLPDDPLIPEPVDAIFTCNTYHHLSDRTTYFAARLADLRPGGRVVVVDFKPGKLPVGPPPEHKIDPASIIAEMKAAGYELIHDDPGLPYQIFYIFAPRDAQ